MRRVTKIIDEAPMSMTFRKAKRKFVKTTLIAICIILFKRHGKKLRQNLLISLCKCHTTFVKLSRQTLQLTSHRFSIKHTYYHTQLVSIVISANIIMFKVNNRDTGQRCKICSKLKIKTTKRVQHRASII